MTIIWLLYLNFHEPHPFHFESKEECVKVAGRMKVVNYKCVKEWR